MKLRLKARLMATRITGKQTRITRVVIERAFQKATKPVQRRTKNEEKRFITITFNFEFRCKVTRFPLRMQAFRGRMYEIENSVYEVRSHTLFHTADICYFAQTMKLIFLILRGSHRPILVPFPAASIDQPIALLPTR